MTFSSAPHAKSIVNKARKYTLNSDPEGKEEEAQDDRDSKENYGNEEVKVVNVDEQEEEVCRRGMVSENEDSCGKGVEMLMSGILRAKLFWLQHINFQKYR